jgi:hypothetical protein
LLRALKREFGFYCIELMAEHPLEPEQLEVAYVIGGDGTDRNTLSSMERYDLSSGQRSGATAMGTRRAHFGACVLAGEMYVIGGYDNGIHLSSVEKYSPLSDTWSAVASLTLARAGHTAVTVGTAVYVLGGRVGHATTASVHKFDCVQVWSQVCPMPEPRMKAAACAVGNDIYVFRGKLTRAQLFETSVYKYDTVANSGVPWHPCPKPVIFILRLCWAVWSTSLGPGGTGTWFCASTQCRVPGALLHRHRAIEEALPASCLADAYMSSGVSINLVWSATTWLGTYGQTQQVCSKAGSALVPSPSGPQAPPRSRTSSTRSSLKPSSNAHEECADGGIAFRFKVENSTTRRRRDHALRGLANDFVMTWTSILI